MSRADTSVTGPIAGSGAGLADALLAGGGEVARLPHPASESASSPSDKPREALVVMTIAFISL
jgi:hypothetical protein